MPHDAGILTWMLNFFMSALSLGHSRVGPDAMSLLGKLALIEITLCGLWWAFGKSDVIQQFIRKCLFIGFFIFVVTQFPYLIDAFLRSFVALGLRAGGGTLGVNSFFDPSTIADYGIRVIIPLLERFEGIGIIRAGIVEAVILGWSGILILIAFFIMAVQIFITLVEFYLLSIVSLCLIPFGVFKHTRFIAERAFGLIFSFGVKVMVLALLVSIASPILSDLSRFLTSDASVYRDYFAVLLAALALCFLFWQAPALAASILSGAPSLTAGSVAGAGVAAAVGGTAAGMAVSAGARSAFEVTRRAATAGSTTLGKVAGAAGHLTGSGGSGTAAGAAANIAGGTNPATAASENARRLEAMAKDKRKPLYASLKHAPMAASHALPPESGPQGSANAPIKEDPEP